MNYQLEKPTAIDMTYAIFKAESTINKNCIGSPQCKNKIAYSNRVAVMAARIYSMSRHYSASKLDELRANHYGLKVGTVIYWPLVTNSVAYIRLARKTMRGD